jgi:hypothetical protein
MEEPRQVQRMRTEVLERKQLRRHGRPRTDEGRESAIPKIWTPAIAVATSKTAPKDERSRKPTTVETKTKMSSSRNIFHLHPRG